MRFLIFLFIFMSIAILFCDNQYLRYNSWQFYSIQFLLCSFYVLRKIRYISFFFLPSSVCFFFLGISFSVGAYFVPLNYGFLNEFYKYQFENVNNFHVIHFFYVNVFNVIFLVLCSSLNKQDGFTGFSFYSSDKYITLKLLLIFSLLISFSVIETFLQFGAQVAIVTYLCFLAMHRRFIIRVIIYTSIMLTLLAFNHESKREILIILMLIVFFVSTEFKLKFNFFSFKMIYLVLLLTLIFGLIISASILRGYGNFEIEFFWQAIYYIPQYLKLDAITDILLDNFEISHTFPACILAVEYVLTGTIHLYYGLTVIKPIFLVVPRELWENKPDSIIEIFTNANLKDLFETGMSLPVSLPGELFINFSALSLFIFFLILLFGDKLFSSAIKSNDFNLKTVLSICLAITFFMLVRGSGFDLYILTGITSLLLAIILSLFVKSTHSKKESYESRNCYKLNT